MWDMSSRVTEEKFKCFSETSHSFFCLLGDFGNRLLQKKSIIGLGSNQSLTLLNQFPVTGSDPGQDGAEH